MDAVHHERDRRYAAINNHRSYYTQSRIHLYNTGFQRTSLGAQREGLGFVPSGIELFDDE